ncbi:hypothetical protein H0G86_005608 [Trichoderma simmonsii]|uniref:Uncharacterized protein n=1 Tax=Trichoderma simmonsii TaxID=1491479 RepID=A0A8G0PGJ3_9HYPO|nr:hypothetical protein H0G86_005608 [Trichoderma simmonsii]
MIRWFEQLSNGYGRDKNSYEIRQPIRCLRLPRVAASSDWLFRSTKSLRPGPSAQQSLSAPKSHRSGTFLLSDDRSPKLNRQIQGESRAPACVIPSQVGGNGT